MQNLVVGGTSQLARYFPEEYTRVSSRGFDARSLGGARFDTAYLCFGEQRTYLQESMDFYSEVNVEYTMKVVDSVLGLCGRIVVYATADLWNAVDGCVAAGDPYKYRHSNYIKSKETLCGRLRGGSGYEKVVIVYPFNFNSVFRGGGFLFGKVFDSLARGVRTTIGDVDFERDMIHPSVVARESMRAEVDTVVGSGEAYNVGGFIRDLFGARGMNFDDYVTIDDSLGFRRNVGVHRSCESFSSYDELLRLSLQDIGSLGAES